VAVLRETAGVEDVYTRDEASAKLRLHHERIGDIVATGAPEVVFGPSDLPGPLTEGGVPPRLRSHASAHEQRVPLIGYNGDFDGFEFSENRDMGRYVFERVLAG